MLTRCSMLALLALPTILPTAATALDLARPGALPFDVVTTPLKGCAATCEIVIEGTVPGPSPVTVVLRMDDPQSSSYASRLNDERTLPPGPFRWRKSLRGLKTVNGRSIDARAVNRMLLFNASDDRRIEVASLKMMEVPSLPVGAIGWSFGAEDAPPVPGFERVGPKDARLAGQVFTIHRPAPDPLVANGLRGIQRVVVPWPAGRARVSLWTEDPGEWESLPHPLERSIAVNGIRVLEQRLSPPQWIRQRYLAGSDREPAGVPDPWLSFGQYRGGLVSVETDSDGQGILIEQAGDSPAAMFLSGVLVEPAGQRAALDAVLGQRAQWYRETWPVGEPMPHRVAHQVKAVIGGVAGDVEPLRLVLAPGTGGRAMLSITSAGTIAHPEITIVQPVSGGEALAVGLWAAQRQLDRVGTGSNLLAIRDDRLRQQTKKFAIVPDEARRYEIWVEAPARARPGLYEGSIAIGEAGRSATVPLSIEVLPVVLPPIEKPSGFFHDEAPHLTWFDWPGDLRRRQMGCDLATLAHYGIDGNAPGLSTPHVNRTDDLLRDAKLAYDASPGRWPVMAYSPAGRALAEQGIDGSVQSIAGSEWKFAEKGLQRLIWSVADEPSNPDLAGGDLRGWVRALRAGVPGIKLAAHLNSKGDRALLPLFDVAIVNAGFGIDSNDLAGIAAAKVEPWLYNTDSPRFTAGLWLWHTPAGRYLQWHARMPTADPFDPTDGREGDAQMFYPGLEICASQPDMNAAVLAMAEGIVDQRWLLWLDRRPEPAARALVAGIKSELGSTFAVNREFDDERIAAVRDRIVAYFRHID